MRTILCLHYEKSLRMCQQQERENSIHIRSSGYLFSQFPNYVRKKKEKLESWEIVKYLFAPRKNEIRTVRENRKKQIHLRLFPSNFTSSQRRNTKKVSSYGRQQVRTKNKQIETSKET